MAEFVRPHACHICTVNPRGCSTVKRDIQRLMDEGILQIHRERGGEPVNTIDDNNQRTMKRSLEDASSSSPKRLCPNPRDSEACEVCREMVDTLTRWAVMTPFSIRREKAKQRALDDSRINSVNEITGPIIPIHMSLYEFSADRHDYENCEICSKDDKGCLDVLWGVQQALDNETIILRYPEPEEFIPDYPDSSHDPPEGDMEFEDRSMDYQGSKSNPDPDHSVNVIVPCFKEMSLDSRE